MNEIELHISMWSQMILFVKIFKKDGNNNPVCETAEETQMHRTVFWTRGRGQGWDDTGEWHWNM